MVRSLKRTILLTSTLFALAEQGFACACGCNVFSVGARWMMPTSAGLGVYLHYNFMNQNRNWGDWHLAPGETNEDKEIRTSFYTAGFQFMPSREWGIMAEVPVWNRYFRTVDDDGNPLAANHVSAGDVRLMGMFTGLSEDMSTGLELGAKLPTGSFHQSLLDRDTQIGTGTTDLLLGGYRMGQEKGWGWYVQALWQHAVTSREEYKPGDSFDITTGVHYDGLLRDLPLVPMFQIIGSFRGIDSGANAYPDDTGYERVFASPGLQVLATSQLSIYGDVRIPLLTHVRGYQLIAPALVSFAMGYNL